MTKCEELEKAIGLLREHAGKLGDATVKAIAASLADAYDEMQEPKPTVEREYGVPLERIPMPVGWVAVRDGDGVAVVRPAGTEDYYYHAGFNAMAVGPTRAPVLIIRREHVLKETGDYGNPKEGEYIRDANGDVYHVSAPSAWGKGPIYVSENEPSHDNYPKD